MADQTMIAALPLTLFWFGGWGGPWTMDRGAVAPWRRGAAALRQFG